MKYIYILFLYVRLGLIICSYFDKIKLEGHFILWSYSTQLPCDNWLKSMYLEFIFSSSPGILFWISVHSSLSVLSGKFISSSFWLTMHTSEIWGLRSKKCPDMWHSSINPNFYVDYGIMINFAVTAAASGDQLNMGRMGCLCQVTSLRPI